MSQDSFGSEALRACGVITDELTASLQAVAPGQVAAFWQAVEEAGRIFCAGAGRSGLMLRTFAMRLMHLGFSVHFVGDVTTPAIQKGDLLIVASGSGATSGPLAAARAAAEKGAGVALLTTRPGSPIGQLAKATVHIPASTPKAEGIDGFASVQPGANLFEQGLLLLLDGMVIAYMERQGLPPQMVMERHANLE